MKLKEFRLLYDTELRKQSRGNIITDEVFNILVNSAQAEYMDTEKDKAELTSGITTELLPFFEEAVLPVTGGAISSSLLGQYEKLMKVNTLYNGELVKCDVCTSKEVEERLDNSLTKPTLKHPIVEEFNDGLKFYPSTVTSATIKYIREPNEVFLDYYWDAIGKTVYMDAGATHTLIPGEVYRDGTTSGTKTSQTVEFEWGASDIKKIFNMVLRDAAVSVDRQLPFSYGVQETTKKEQGL